MVVVGNCGTVWCRIYLIIQCNQNSENVFLEQQMILDVIFLLEKTIFFHWKNSKLTISIIPLKFLEIRSNVSLCQWNEGSWLWGVIVIRNFYLSLLNLC